MHITRIVEQVKQKGRYSIYVDGGYAFSLSESALLASGLAVKQALDANQLQQWKQTSAEDKIYGRALRYAAMRPRSTWELEQYLSRKDASPALAEMILNKLRNIGLLDDAAFACSYVAGRRLLRPASKRKLQQELRAKHVGDDAVRQALAEDDDAAEEGGDRAALRAIIAKKRRQPRYADNTKLLQYLARQGFSYDDIKDALGREEP